MDRSAGGVIIVFAGVVLLIAAVKGSLGNLWKSVLTPDSSGGSGSGTGASGTGTTPQTGPPAGFVPGQTPGSTFPIVGGNGIPAGWPGSGQTTG